MHNPGEITGFGPKSCYLRPSSNPFMNVMQQPGPNLPNDTVPGAPRSDGETFFDLHLYAGRKMSQKFPKYQGPRAITWLVGVIIYSIETIHLHLANFYGTKHF